MNHRLWLQASLFLSSCLLPLAAVALYVGQQQKLSPGSYRQFHEQLKPPLRMMQPYERQKVLKQIWFQPLGQGPSLYLQAERSQLFVESDQGRIRASERLHDVLAAFQEYSSRTRQTPRLTMRLLRSSEALFDYSKQMLQAQQVAIELYPLTTPLDLAKEPLPEPALAMLAGSAEEVEINCRTASFKADRFRASVHPLSETP